ncbi:MAG: hypothetical protein ACD_46C00467G0003, partial [uncultured bacterium]
AEQYKNNGYYIAHHILPSKALKNTLYEMDIILVQQLNYLGCAEQATDSQKIIHHHMRELYEKNQFVYVQALKLWAKLFSLQALIMNENIVSITNKLGITLPVFQTTPVLHIMANDLKITGGYHGVGVHQDWPALQSGLDTITVWFPFMDVDINNFPVELIPESHTDGLYPGKIAEHIYEVDPKFYEEKNFVPMEVKFGDVLFMSNFTLHRSGLRGDQRLRIACSSRYENASEKTFIERAYPSAQKRVIQRELLQPNFPQKIHLDEIYS